MTRCYPYCSHSQSSLGTVLQCSVNLNCNLLRFGMIGAIFNLFLLIINKNGNHPYSSLNCYYLIASHLLSYSNGPPTASSLCPPHSHFQGLSSACDREKPTPWPGMQGILCCDCCRELPNLSTADLLGVSLNTLNASVALLTLCPLPEMPSQCHHHPVGHLISTLILSCYFLKPFLARTFHSPKQDCTFLLRALMYICLRCP